MVQLFVALVCNLYKLPYIMRFKLAMIAALLLASLSGVRRSLPAGAQAES